MSKFMWRTDMSRATPVAHYINPHTDYGYCGSSGKYAVENKSQAVWERGDTPPSKMGLCHCCAKSIREQNEGKLELAKLCGFI